MAIDSREKRQSTNGLLLHHVPSGVDAALPGFPRSSRQASVMVYAGIGSGLAGVLRELILAAVAARLATIAGWTIRRDARRALDDGLLPALVQRDAGDGEPGIDLGSIAMRRAHLTIEVMVKGAGAGAQVSVAHAAVVQALAGDRTLGGLAVDARIAGGGVTWPARGIGEPALAAATIEIEVDYWSRVNDPGTLGP